MGPAQTRFDQWATWSKLSDKAIAERLGCDPSYPRKLRHERRRPGLDVAHAIERVTAEAREDGECWTPGPIRTEEWLDVVDVGRSLADDLAESDTTVEPKPRSAA